MSKKSHQNKPKRRLQKKRKRKHLRKSSGSVSAVQAAAQWQIYECLISDEWTDTRQLTQVLLARQSPIGQIAVAAFVIDQGCLGAKDGLLRGFDSVVDYEVELRDKITQTQRFITCDPPLALKVIVESIDYAKALGFRPHRDAVRALNLFGDVDPQKCDVEIPVGDEDGKPFYMAGPYDDVENILRTLEKNAGTGNYHYLAAFGDGSLFDWR
jgi:hypothetical protein